MHELIHRDMAVPRLGSFQWATGPLGFVALLTLLLLAADGGRSAPPFAQNSTSSSSSSSDRAAARAEARESAQAQEAPEAPEKPVRVIQLDPDDVGAVFVAGSDEAYLVTEEDPTAKAEDMYRRLFLLQTQLAREEQIALRDSLKAEVKLLQKQIDAHYRELREMRELEADEERLDDEWEDLRRELERSAESGDMESFDESLAELLEGLDELGEEIGRHIGQLQVEISAERFRLDTGSGGYIDVQIDDELIENLAKGMEAFGTEIGQALDDSALGRLGQLYLDDEDLDNLPPALQTIVDRVPRRRQQRRVIGRSLFKLGSPAEVAEDEYVKGDVVALFGDVIVEGQVLGRAIAVFGNLIIAEDAVVESDAVSVGGRVQMESGGSVGGKVIDVGRLLPGGEGLKGAAPLLILLYLGIRLAVLVLLAIIILALIGDRIEIMVEYCSNHMGSSFGLGLIWWIVAASFFAIAFSVLMVTVVGIPVAFLLLVAFLGLMLTAYYVTCRLLGDRVLKMLGKVEAPAAWLSTLLGICLLEAPVILLFAFAYVISPEGSAEVLPRLADITIKVLAISAGLGGLVKTRLGGGLHGTKGPTSPVEPETASV